MKLSTYRQACPIAVLADDRAMLEDPIGGPLRLVTTNLDQHTYFVVELTRDECERIAEALGWSRPGAPPWPEEEEED